MRRYERPLWPVRLRDRCASTQKHHCGAVRERRPHLLAVDDPLVAVEHAAGLHVREVGAGVRLGVALAPQLLDRLDLGEEAPLLLVGAVGEERRGEEALAEEADPRRRVRLGVLLVEDDLLGEVARRARRTPRATRARASGPRRGAAPTRRGRPSRARRPGRHARRSPRSRPSGARRATPRTSSRNAASAGVSVKSMRARRRYSSAMPPSIVSLHCGASTHRGSLYQKRLDADRGRHPRPALQQQG